MKRLQAHYLEILSESENIPYASGKCILQDVDQIVRLYLPANKPLPQGEVSKALHAILAGLQTLLNDGINYNTFIILRAYALKQVKSTKIIAKKI